MQIKAELPQAADPEIAEAIKLVRSLWPVEGAILLFLISDGERLLVPSSGRRLRARRLAAEGTSLPPTDLEGGEAADDPTEVKIGPLIIGVSRPNSEWRVDVMK
jgi:hypothetical protein